MIIQLWRASTTAANLRTEACDERSAMNVATVAPLPAAALMRADAMPVRVLLRPTTARFAPSAASASAAARPMPLVAPVIRDLLVVHGTAIQGSGHARMICLIIFDCRRGDGVNLSMLSRARHENSPRPCAIKNPGKGSPSPAKAAHFPIVTGEGMLSCPPHANNLVGAAFG